MINVVVHFVRRISVCELECKNFRAFINAQMQLFSVQCGTFSQPTDIISGHSDELERSIKNKCVPGQDISLIYRIYIRCLQGNSERRSFTATGLRGTGTRTLPPCLKNNQN